MRGRLSESLLHFFAGPLGFLDAEKAVEHTTEVASANWYATATLAAGELGEGLLVDVGSTTTDILRFVDHSLLHRGYSDGERQASDELIYTGVVRTPLLALTRRVPFAGEWVGLAAEHFATTADVHRLTGDLPANADLMETADGGAKTPFASARRLARMIGRDREEGTDQCWGRLAAYLSEQQLLLIANGCQRQLSLGLGEQAPLVGAGVGRFLVQRLAKRLGRPYVDINRLMTITTEGRVSAADCAPAVAVALLLSRNNE
jgi:probable H4MPT-linked C1 transfer pathway protein